MLSFIGVLPETAHAMGEETLWRKSDSAICGTMVILKCTQIPTLLDVALIFGILSIIRIGYQR